MTANLWRAGLRSATMPTVFMRPATLRFVVSCVLAAGPVTGTAAQQGGQPPPPGQGGGRTGAGVVEWSLPRQEPRLPRGIDPYYTFPGVESVAPDFRGFPLYAPDSPAFGGYPGLPGFRPEVLRARGESPSSLLLAPGAPRPEGLWPSWLMAGSATTDRARPDQAVLVRISDRVWYRGKDEEAYIPVPFHDRIKTLEVGAGVQVRTMSGDFSVYLHDSASMQSVGPIHLETVQLTELAAEFDLLDVWFLRLDARKRSVRLRLLDQSVLEIAESQVRLTRVGDRIVLRNEGPNAFRVRTGASSIEVPANREVAVLATPPPAAVPSTALVVHGTAQTRIDARRATLTGGSGGGTVEWLGARIKLGAGAGAVLEAAGGDSFPEFRASGAESGQRGPRQGTQNGR